MAVDVEARLIRFAVGLEHAPRLREERDADIMRARRDGDPRVKMLVDRVVVADVARRNDLESLDGLAVQQQLDLVRLAALGAAPPLSSRGEIRQRLLDGDLAPDLAGPLEPLRQFVRHVARHRLRRLCFAQQTERLRLAGRLLDESLRLLGRCYADPDLLALPGVADQFDHFYTAGRFTPTGARVRLLGAAERDFVELVNEVRRGRADGVHLVLESHGVRVNLANVDPALGNCTVVPVPASARDQ